MIKCFILDDEPDCINALRKLLTKYHPEIEITGEAESTSEAYKLISQAAVKPDILFLDIHMPAENGFSFLERFNEIDFTVIFITAFDSYAIKAIRYSALDYLLKPIDKDELKQTLNRYKNLPQNKNNEKLSGLKENISSGRIFNKLAIPALSEIIFIKKEDILYLESDNNYTAIHTVAKAKIVSSRNIGYYEELLEDEGFFRIHNSCIINVKKMGKYTRGKSGYVELEDGTKLEVAKRKKEDFMKLIELM